jgi:hypothetical protein
MSAVVSVNTKADAAGTPVPHIAAN